MANRHGIIFTYLSFVWFISTETTKNSCLFIGLFHWSDDSYVMTQNFYQWKISIPNPYRHEDVPQTQNTKRYTMQLLFDIVCLSLHTLFSNIKINYTPSFAIEESAWLNRPVIHVIALASFCYRVINLLVPISIIN